MSESTQFLMTHGDTVLFAMVFAEQAGLPLPAAPWLLAAGALSASGALNPVLAVAIVALACILPDWIWFSVGRRGGQRVLRWFCRMSLAPCACRGRTKDLFARHGLQGLVAAKFIPGLGAIMPPMAGALGVSTSRFLIFDGLGSLLYGAFYVVAGFLFHTQVQKVMAVLNGLGVGLALAAGVLVLGYFVFKYVRRIWPTLRTNAARPGLAITGLLVAEPGGRRGGFSPQPESLRGLLRTKVHALPANHAPSLTSGATGGDAAPAPSSLVQPVVCGL